MATVALQAPLPSFRPGKDFQDQQHKLLQCEAVGDFILQVGTGVQFQNDEGTHMGRIMGFSTTQKRKRDGLPAVSFRFRYFQSASCSCRAWCMHL